MRTVQIPLDAVMSTIEALAGRSAMELRAQAAEDFVSEEDDLSMGSATADDRAALVAFLFRLSDEAERQGLHLGSSEDFEAIDEATAWARDAGWEDP